MHTELPRIEEIALFSRRLSTAEAVANDCRQRWGAPVRAVATIEDALHDADVALTVTTAQEPLIRAHHIKNRRADHTARGPRMRVRGYSTV